MRPQVFERCSIAEAHVGVDNGFHNGLHAPILNSTAAKIKEAGCGFLWMCGKKESVVKLAPFLL